MNPDYICQWAGTLAQCTASGLFLCLSVICVIYLVDIVAYKIGLMDLIGTLISELKKNG